jgi:polyisoprenoid-binding protein YceI
MLIALLMGAVAGCGTASHPGATTTSKPPCVAPAAGTRVFLITPGTSTAQYTAQEKITLPAIKSLLRIVGDDNTAIGKTRQLVGQIELDGVARKARVDITADLRTLDSGVGLRDQRIRDQFLESNRFPFAVYRATAVSLPANPTEGTDLSFDAPGTMTIRNNTRPFVFQVTARVSGDVVSGVATGRLKMSDFGFDPPVIEGAIAVQEGLDIKVDFSAAESACLPPSS